MKLTALTILSAVAMAGLSAQADTSFGNLAGATFAGTGISTSNTEIVTAAGYSGDIFTLGLTATPYKVGTVGNNGNGTFSAPAGVSPANPNRATWNFDFYVNINNAADLQDYNVSLNFTDGTTANSYGAYDIAYFDNLVNGAPSYTPNTAQDSENITFFGYNPATTGTYTFDLVVGDDSGTVADDQITVIVGGGAVPDAASTASMLAIAGAGLAFARRKMSR